MLKSMRKNVKSLAPVMWIVIIAFVITIFAVWGGAGRTGDADWGNTLVSVGKSRITGEEYFHSLRQRLESMRREFPDLNADIIRQLNLTQQTLEQMIQQKLLLQIAREQKIRTTDAEVRDSIMSYPVFQRDGRFIGFEEYRRILSWNRIDIGEFEENIRRDTLINKVIRLVTAGIVVTEDEVWGNFRNQNETARIEYLIADIEKTEAVEEEPSPDEIRTWFESRKDVYAVPETRAGDYVFFRNEDMKTEIEIPEAEIEAYYRENLSQFQEPEQIRIGRILLPLEDEDRTAALEEAADLLDRLRSGSDFAMLARLYSEDPKASEGGDWGFFEWMSLSPRETQAARTLGQGEISEVIEIDGGVVLLKALEKTPEQTRPLEEVRGTVQNLLEDKKTRELAAGKIAALEKAAKRDKSLDVAAQREGLRALETGLLKKGDPLLPVDDSGTLSETLFGLAENEISSPVYTFTGVGLVQLRTIEPSRPAELDEVREKVIADLRREKRKTRTLERIWAVRDGLNNDWEAAAGKTGLEFNAVEAHKRGQYLGMIGENDEIDALAFSLPPGEISEAVDIGRGYALLRVLDRKEVTREEFEAVRTEERNTLLEEKKNKFLQSFLTQAREDRNVKINSNLLMTVNQDVLSRYTRDE
jgi:peptidyl-prolyl cis-trans isomerase D